jgi:DNA-binding protein Fis
MATAHLPRFPMPSLSSGQVETLLFHSADIVLTLADDDTVIDVLPSVMVDPRMLIGWIGKPIFEIIADDSLPKLPMLFADDASDRLREARWRHLNFEIEGGDGLPLLVKYFQFKGANDPVRLIVARDLRPVHEIQRQFQEAQLALGEQVNRLTRESGKGDADQAALRIGLSEIGQKPLDVIIAETAQALERICIAEAMKLTHGNEAKAAALLGLSEGDLAHRLKGFDDPATKALTKMRGD